MTHLYFHQLQTLYKARANQIKCSSVVSLSLCSATSASDSGDGAAASGCRAGVDGGSWFTEVRHLLRVSSLNRLPRGLLDHRLLFWREVFWRMPLEEPPDLGKVSRPGRLEHGRRRHADVRGQSPSSKEARCPAQPVKVARRFVSQ